MLTANRLILSFLFCISISCVNGQFRPADTLVRDSILNHIGDIQIEYSDSAIEMVNALEAEIIASGDSVGLMRVYIFRGLDAYYRVEYDEAIKFYYQALEMSERYERQVLEGVICNNLGTVFFDMQQLETSTEFFKRAKAIMEKLNNYRWLARISGNFAGVAFMQGKPDLAIELLNESIEYGVMAGNFVSVSGAYANLAMVYNGLDRKDEALDAFARGVTMLEEVGDKRGVCIVLNKLASLQHELNDLKSAQETAYRSILLAKEIGHKESIMEGHKILAEVFKESDVDSSLFHLEQYISWKDSVYSEDKYETISELKEKYQNEKNNEIILRMEAESQKTEAVKDRQTLQIWALTILMILAVVIIAFVFFQLKSKKTKNQILQEKNELAQSSLDEKELLMREIHHRVKNNFQLVSGVLMVQASTTENEMAKEALMKVRDRIQSMAHTHQRLYTSDRISGVNSVSFVEELVNDVKLSFDENDTELKLDLQNFELPIDTAVTIGLVITEAIINSFKYAFKEGSSGQIIVQLSQAEAISLMIADNGKGLPEEYEPSFGMKMINNLATKAGGKARWENRIGTFVEITLPIK